MIGNYIIHVRQISIDASKRKRPLCKTIMNIATFTIRLPYQSLSFPQFNNSTHKEAYLLTPFNDAHTIIPTYLPATK